MNRITSEARTVRQLLLGVKYSIDYYQREYKWQTENISELLQDLETKFMQSYDPRHARDEGTKYDNYFMGSIVISERKSQRYIIDGQQRLTSLTLLLIYLNHLQKGCEGFVEELPQLIRSTDRGKYSYNLNVDERAEILDALFSGQDYDVKGKPESIRNMMSRYEDIQKFYPDSLREEKPLLFFIDWLLNNVTIVEITAYSDDDAYMIFETMNDRGISLSPIEMLKGYLLSNVPDSERLALTNHWRSRIEMLVPPDSTAKDEDANFFKAWFRARYAATIRTREKNAIPEDYDKIGTAFHKWVYDKSSLLGLDDSSDFRDFLWKQFTLYSDHYVAIRKAAYTFDPDFECIYYNRHCGFTLQTPLILSSLEPDDNQEVVKHKMRLVSRYLDIFIARHIWNYNQYDYNRIYYNMFLLMRELRGKSVPQLATILRQRIDALNNMPFGDSRFGRNLMNRWRVHYILARITYHIEQQSDIPSTFTQYIDNRISKPYEIEHIWSNKFDLHRDEFSYPNEFAEYRNRVGGLILIQRGDNQAFGDKPYEQKVAHYYRENLLASSLNEKSYEARPSFLAYVRRSGLPFKGYAHFSRAELDERQALYRDIAKEIWSTERFEHDLQ